MMAILRVVVLLLGALAAPSQAGRSIRDHMGTGAWLTESCQDYPYEVGLSLNDTVRIFKPNSTYHNYVESVGCQDPHSPGMICLGLKGCYKPEELRHASTSVFLFDAVSEAAGGIVDAIGDDSKDVWKDVNLSLSASGVFASRRIYSSLRLAHSACSESPHEIHEMLVQKLDMAAVRTHSLLVIIVNSAVEAWGKTTSVAENTMAKLVKIANHLSEKASDFYNDHLKDFVEVLKRYLGTIADAVMDIPEKFSANRPPPTDEEQKLQEMGEPSGLTAAIEGFIDKVGELGAKLVEFSRGLYETVAEGLGALMSGTGRLIAAASSRFSRVKAVVHQLASDAVSKVQRWRREAGDIYCNFVLGKNYMVDRFWPSVQEASRKAMDAVQHGYSLQSVSATVDFMRDNCEWLRGFQWIARQSWERSVVRGSLYYISVDLMHLNILIQLVIQRYFNRFERGIMKYVDRFTPQWVKEGNAAKKTEIHKSIRERAKKVQEDTELLVGALLTVGPSVF